MPTTENIFPENIRLDGSTQPRAKIEQAVCDDYGKQMRTGDKFPPIDVFFDGQDYWLADGFHRLQAYVMALPGEAVECNVFQGSLADAQWHSYSVNKTHGIRRTKEDKERAVKLALQHAEGVKKSDSEVAKHVGVDHKTVAKYRAKMSASWEIPKIDTRTVTRGKSTYRQNTVKIGKSPKTGRGKCKKQGNRISPNAAVPILGHSLPNPTISLNLSPNNPMVAAATIFKLFDATFVRALVAELAQRLKGAA